MSKPLWMLIFYKAKPQHTKAIASFYFTKNRAVVLPHSLHNIFSSLEKVQMKSSDEEKNNGNFATE